MSKNKKKKDRVKLPKRLMGVKIPKETRRTINALLKDIPATSIKPTLLAAIGTLASGIVARFEGDRSPDEAGRNKAARARPQPASSTPLPH